MDEFRLAGNTPEYEGSKYEFFTAEIHHGGQLKEVGHGSHIYMGGSVVWADNLNPDYMSWWDMEECAKKLGYEDVNVYYRKPGTEGENGLEKGLELMKFDRGFCNMIESLPPNRVAVIFLDHGIPSSDVSLQVHDSQGVISFPVLQPNIELDQSEPQVHTEPKFAVNLVDVEVRDPGNVNAHVEGEDDEASENDGDETPSDDEDSNFADSDYDQDEEDDDALFDKYVEDAVNDSIQNEWLEEDQKSDDGAWSDLDELQHEDDSEEQSRKKIKRKMPKFPQFRRETDLRNARFRIGMEFASTKDFKDAVKEDFINHGRPYKFPINDWYKVQGICKNKGCPWVAYASMNTKQRNATLQVKTLVTHHTCPRDENLTPVNSTWLADTYAHELKINPKWDVKLMQARVRLDYMANISIFQAYRARDKANVDLQGSYQKQYAKLWDYYEELRRSNPGSNVTMTTTLVENKSSWTWFLNLFIADLGIRNGSRWVFISDKQKGLLPSIKELVPDAEHRHCVRHLYNNFKGEGHQGLELKQRLWAAARATTLPLFEAEMNTLEKLDRKAYGWLQDRDATNWSRSHFKEDLKCDILLNNLCESFNSAILKSRDKPVLYMLESLRMYLMIRMAKQRTACDKWHGEIGPRIFDILEKNKVVSSECFVYLGGGGKWQVVHKNETQYVVNLSDHTCSCRKWNLTGICRIFVS